MTRALDAFSVLSAATLLVVAAAGGFEIAAGPIAFRAHDWLRPAIALAVALGARAALGSRRTNADTGPGSVLAADLLLAIVVAATIVYSQWHVRVAGGLDSYGYVSAATSLASGHLHQPQPLAAVLPFDAALGAATPLGHVPAADGRSSVPRFPLGLPVVMALFSTIHPLGPFFVPHAMAYATLVLAYATGRSWSDRLTGLFSAALVAVNPVFVVSAIQPMSDVPAACWLLGAIWAVQDDAKAQSPAWSVVSGLCAGMAVLTRPVLLPATAVLVLVTATRGSWRCSVVRAGTLAASVVLQMWLNIDMYGTATGSGYGTTSHMFELSATRAGANVSNFAKWTLYSGAAVWLFWPAALAILRRERRAWELSAVGAAAAAPYLFYLVFDNWDSTRFLLPAIVPALVVCARGISKLLEQTPQTRAWRPAVLLAIAFGGGLVSQRFLVREQVAAGASLEAKYPLVGEWFRSHTPERAVVLSSLHSGSIRMYGGRQTVRWDLIPPDAAAATIAGLAAAGYEPYVALDLPSEPPLFEERFRTSHLQLEPVARVRVVNIYKVLSAR
jgi:hypothetical protein